MADDAGAAWTVCEDDSGNGRFEPQLADGRHTVEIREVNDGARTLPGLQLHLDARHRRPRARDDHQRPGRDHDQHHRDVRVQLRAGRLRSSATSTATPGCSTAMTVTARRTYTDLAVGKHTFKVWRDRRGRAIGSPASEYSFTGDRPAADDADAERDQPDARRRRRLSARASSARTP